MPAFVGILNERPLPTGPTGLVVESIVLSVNAPEDVCPASIEMLISAGIERVGRTIRLFDFLRLRAAS